MTKAKSGRVSIMTKPGGRNTLKIERPTGHSVGSKAGGIYTRDMVLRSTPELVRIVKAGVPVSDARKLLSYYKVESEKFIEFVGDSPSKFRKRRSTERLQPEESDRLVRFARLLAAAEALHEGDAEAARRWMESPNKALGGVAPMEYARTEVGAREVEQLIGRLEHGVFS